MSLPSSSISVAGDPAATARAGTDTSARVRDFAGHPTNWWTPLVEFATHVTVGTCLFLIVLLPAVALDYLVHWLAGTGTSKELLRGLKAAEWLLFGADVAVFSVFIVWTSWNHARKIVS
jgi:hypothetical protein